MPKNLNLGIVTDLESMTSTSEAMFFLLYTLPFGMNTLKNAQFVVLHF